MHRAVYSHIHAYSHILAGGRGATWGAPALALAAAQLTKIMLDCPASAAAQYEVDAPEGSEATLSRSTGTSTSRLL